MLVAEELVLLSLLPDGTVARQATEIDVSAACVAAVVAELELHGGVVTDEDHRWNPGSNPPPPNAHPLLQNAYQAATEHPGERFFRVSSLFELAGRDAVIASLQAQGVLDNHRGGLLGATRQVIADPAAHAALLERTRGAALSSGPFDRAEDAILLAMLGVARQLEVIAPDPSERSVVKKRMRQAFDITPAAQAADKAALDSRKIVRPFDVT